jgi:hypothetical protein
MLVSSLGSSSESLVKLSSLFMIVVLDHDTDDIDVKVKVNFGMQ